MAAMTKKIIKGESFRTHGDLASQVKGEPAGRPTAVRVVRAAGGVLAKKVLAAQSEAEEIVAAARTEADRIRAEAQRVLAEVEQVREASRATGFAEGREEGLAGATTYTVQLQEWKQRFYDQAEAEIIRLVLTIAEKVIGKMVTEHKAAIQGIVRQAIESSLGDRIVVRLNPEDFRVITAADFEFRELLDRTKRLLFKEDAAITKGGCVVETEVGTIDAQLETQMKAIRKALQL